jgi:hypothetical protein
MVKNFDMTYGFSVVFNLGFIYAPGFALIDAE